MLTPTSSRLVWDGHWRVRVMEYRAADGRVLERATVEHPGAVVLVPLRPGPTGPEVLMLRQYRIALQQEILELPAGTREWDEDWEVCAQRELQEETGFRAEHLLPLGEIWPAPGISDERMALYLAFDLRPSPLPGDEDEAIIVEPWSLDALVSMALDGRLQDGKSIVAILRTADFLSRGGEN